MLSKMNDALYSDITSGGETPSISFKRLSPQRYRVDVTGASNPFMLVHAEAYDNHWVAKMEDGETIDPLPLYKTINGFPIDRKGNFSLVVEYQPQQWFQVGLAISLTAVFISLLFLLILGAKNIRRPSGLLRLYDRLARKACSAAHSYTMNLPHVKRKQVKKDGADPPAPAAPRPNQRIKRLADRTANSLGAGGVLHGWVRGCTGRNRNIVTWAGTALASVLLATFVSATSAVIVSFFLLALLLRMESGVPFTAALVLLLCCPLLLFISRSHVEAFAAWAYCFLAIGIILLVVDYFRSAPGAGPCLRETRSSQEASCDDT